MLCEVKASVAVHYCFVSFPMVVTDQLQLPWLLLWPVLFMKLAEA